MMQTNNLLIIFMKAPHPGRVKTRLQPHLSPDDSLLLYRAMGKDLIENLSGSPDYTLEIHFSPQDALTEMQVWLGQEQRYVPQSGGDLGERMHHSFQTAFARGYGRVVIIGSDLPTLGEGEIKTAFSHLATYPVVLGPTDDGGYYLIGLREAQPVLFQNIAWSTGEVLPQTLHNARDAQLPVHLLEQKADIDTFAEVRALWKELSGRGDTGSLRISHTFAVLKKIMTSD